MAKKWGFKVERTVVGQEGTKRAMAAAKVVEGKKIADQLERNKSATLSVCLE